MEGWNAEYPEKLLANDKILISNGTYTNVYGIDRKAYAVWIAPLSGGQYRLYPDCNVYRRLNNKRERRTPL